MDYIQSASVGGGRSVFLNKIISKVMLISTACKCMKNVLGDGDMSEPPSSVLPLII